jgi:hypothetical protein
MGSGADFVVGAPDSSLLSSRKEAALLSNVDMTAAVGGRTAPCNKEIEERCQLLVV